MQDQHSAQERPPGSERTGVLVGNLPGVESIVLEAANADIPDTAGPTGIRIKRLRRARSTPQTVGSGSRKGRRTLGHSVAIGIRRLWIPLVILIVMGAGGFTVFRLHGIFGSDNSVAYGDANVQDTEPFNAKKLRYEIFGPPGTVADVSYFDGNGEPQSEDGVVLPWSLEFPMTGAMGVGSIAAQGDSSRIGCRILVDGALKDENIQTHEVSTFTSCRLKAA